MKRLFKTKNSDLPEFWKRYKASFDVPLPAVPDKIPFVVLDTETTGLDPEEDRILSIGALRLQHNIIRVKDSVELYVRQEHYDHSTAGIHCILKEEGPHCMSESEAMERLLGYLEGAVLIGHHIRFDVAMVNKALHRLGLPGLKNKAIDTGTLYKQTLIRSPLLPIQKSYTLDHLADKFDLSRKDRHTALGDAYLTALAFLKIVDQLQKKGKITSRSLLRNY